MVAIVAGIRLEVIIEVVGVVGDMLLILMVITIILHTIIEGGIPTMAHVMLAEVPLTVVEA